MFISLRRQVLLPAALIGALAIPAVIPAATEPSTPAIVDEHGTVVRTSIASLEPVTVNGTKQWLLLRGHDIWSPVVLCLDALPGMSDLPLHRRYATALEKQFIVVGWDPRGTGKSYAGPKAAGLFVDQYVSDAVAVAQQLKERFRQEKIYLVGHGFGAVVGALAAQRAPELFHAFVAVDPIVNAGDEEQASYGRALDAATARGDVALASRLKTLGRPPYAGRDMAAKYAALREAVAQASYDGYPANEYRRTRLVTLAEAPEYSAAERQRLSASEAETFAAVYPQLLALHLDREVPQLDVPVYFVLGRHAADIQPTKASAYFDAITAPKKGLVWFEASGRSPMHEEPERFLRVMADRVMADTLPALHQTH
jgi:pimeloyl-ACP methyl ester carboxylesterase